MGKALSVHLRIRVLAAVGQGATHREAAARFGLSAASVSRWRALQEVQGDVRPGPLGGDRRSSESEKQAQLILELLDQMRDATIEELRRALGAQGHRFGYAALRSVIRRPNGTRPDSGLFAGNLKRFLCSF
jgi:transposase